MHYDEPAAVELYRRAVHHHNQLESIQNLVFLLLEAAPGAEPDVPAAVDLYRRAVTTMLIGDLFSTKRSYFPMVHRG